MSNLKFKCPACDNSVRPIEQVVVNAVYSHELIFEDNYIVDFVDLEMHDGIVERHQCKVCGYTIKDSDGEPIDNEEDLIDWLKQQSYNQK